MTDMTGKTDKHRLISRIVDREDRPTDWANLETVAQQDSAAWKDLLFALRDDAEVRHAVDAQLAVADAVALPTTSCSPSAGNGWSTAAVLAAAGWLAAVVVALLWLGSTLIWSESPAGEDLVQLEAPRTEPAAEPAAGHVVGELPRLMVEARPIAGREEIEVIYVRRTLERVLVKKAYQLKLDESGQPFTVPADLTAYMPPRTY
jgi:hypothetical protein